MSPQRLIIFIGTKYPKKDLIQYPKQNHCPAEVDLDEEVEEEEEEEVPSKKKAKKQDTKPSKAAPSKDAGSNGDDDADAEDDADKGLLLTETVKPRDLSELPPLFTRLQDRKAERLHYLGVSYGLTQGLHAFWSKLGFRALYLRQTESDVTGEHTCIMLKALASEDLANKVRILYFHVREQSMYEIHIVYNLTCTMLHI